jgi:hypothetical protein
MESDKKMAKLGEMADNEEPDIEQIWWRASSKGKRQCKTEVGQTWWDLGKTRRLEWLKLSRGKGGSF